MRVVGDRLAEWAAKEKKPESSDVYSRSAFNRYYYATYLLTREMLKELQSSWAKSGHKQIPEILENALLEKSRRTIKNASKSGMISHSEASRFRNSIDSAVSDLSALLRVAYSVRVIADYSPEVRVTRERGNFRLGSHSLNSACRWPDRASIAIARILRAWKELGLV